MQLTSEEEIDESQFFDAALLQSATDQCWADLL
jgi:hypothetical protein